MAARLLSISRNLQAYINFTPISKPILLTSTLKTIPKDSWKFHVRFCSGEVLKIRGNASLHVGMCSENCEDHGVAEKRNVSVEKLFLDIGIPLSKVKKQMDITRLSLGRVKEKMDVLQSIGLKVNDLSKVLSRRPSVLVIKNEVLTGRVEAMRQVGIEPAALVHIVKKSPGVLTARTEETITPKIKYLLSLRVKPKLTKEEVLHMLTKCPDIIASCSLESIQTKVNFFEKVLKFNQQQLRNVLLKQPTVLTFSTESMKSKYAYCYDVLNASRSSIARCPRVFQCSLRRIKERHQFLLKAGRLSDDTMVDDYGLGVITTQTDKYFAEKIALSTFEEFVKFRENFEDGFKDSN